MATLSLTETTRTEQAVSARLTWRTVAGALGGDSLSAFPPEAFEEEVVVLDFFGRRHILVQRPAAIRHILVDNPQNYARLPAVRRILRPMFGSGLFLSTGEEWRRQRHEVAPAFAPRRMQALASQIVAAASGLAADLDAFGDRPADLLPHFQRLALEIIGGAFFSLDMSRYDGALRELILRYAVRLSRPSLADFLLPLAIPSPADFARARFRRRWRRLIGAIVRERTLRGRGAGDLFDLFAAPDRATGATADPERIGDQVATIIVAGHETTAAALFWTHYLLARHPDAQERLAAEIARHRPNAENAAEVLSRLTYTRAVIDEALRLYPPAFVIARQALDEDVADGIPVRKGALVLVAPWVLHRHRRFWSAPQRFDPSRFLPGAPAPPRHVYMPFGAGPRTCVGAPFALTELVLVVATIIGSLRVELAPHPPVHPVGRVTLQPDSSPPFTFHRRTES